MRKPGARRKLSMTSLIDVIFLLLLFFMLTSTFSKFSEVELTASAHSSGAKSDAPPLFLRLSGEEVSVNGQTFALDMVAEALRGQLGDDADITTPRSVLVALRDGVTSQRLMDLLVAIRGVAGIAPVILEGSS
ncbi:hypothetical protein P775_13635 [Puniceibacterium antarcticum]|uniref:Biopolymer transporter ExbD n=1 Tax=Puniceibacterium antarcticum TaxID=1206336 RepID=A0A2G8RDF0_9RHOB|nr:biopolymer transporter ExbD [Puniceibacterium antarcticum]PIL19560.1 hypothetical protein P775_13635 [Puniceibacterium antarcticum]